MPEDLVLYERDEAVGIVTMNRPDKLNALSRELRQALLAGFKRAEEDPETSVIILRSEGRSFCVGYDIGPGDTSKDGWRHDALKWHEYLSGILQFEMSPWYVRKPVIASIQGHALGGGCELAMFCDLSIAADNALFGEPEVRFSDTGPGIVMPWVIGLKRARELLYLGDMIDAKTAAEYGMINKVVPLADLKAETLKYAKRLALISPEALMWTKMSINRGAEAGGFRNAMLAGLDVLAPLYAAKTEVGVKFGELTETQGLQAALKWRMSQFKV